MSREPERRLRVLLACDFFLRYSSMLAAGLADGDRADVALLTRDHDLEFGGRAGAAERFVERATGGRVERVRIAGRVRSPRALAAAVRARRQVGRFEPDVVHLQESIGNDARLLLASGARPRRFALTVHDPMRHPGDDVARLGALANRALIRGAGLIFVHGTALREELTELAKPRAPIVVVPHGVDPGDPQPFPERPTVLFFGRISHYKGLDVLLDAMPAVWDRIPDAALVVAGEGDVPGHPTLGDPRVTLRDEHVPDEDVPALIASATCVALPYRQASQSGVGSLVKRHARPLVATAVGGLPELVGDGSGLLVPPADSERLAEALVSLLSDPELARRLGDTAAVTAAAGADWETVADLTLRAYEEHLLAPSRGRRP